MTRLKSNITLLELSELIRDVVAGSADDWTFLDNPDKAYVSVHEALVLEDKELLDFTTSMCRFLTDTFGKKIPAGKYNNNSDASYSTFAPLFVSQGGIVRVLWLNGKILSILVGSRPLKIINPENKKKPEIPSYAASYFGFSKDSPADLSLSTEDKEVLIALPTTSWLVSNEKTSVSPRNDDYCKSLSVSKGYIRHGSMEKLVDSDDISFLIYPKQDGNLFNQGGSSGSGLPGLINILSKFDYLDLLDCNVLSGEWNRYRDYDNTVFMASKDLTPYIKDKTYLKISFNSVTSFSKQKNDIKKKDIISRKHSVLTTEDSTKYFDNPRYHVVFSPDKTMYYICKSDKLKATALQTKITKSMREDFIAFINWIGYYALAADLNPANLGKFFMPMKLVDAKTVTWAEMSLARLAEYKKGLTDHAAILYRQLYMGESEVGTVNPLSGNRDLFDIIYSKYSTGSRYHAPETDPHNILTFQISSNLFSFNKKFSLDISLINIMRLFCNSSTERSNDKVCFGNPSDIMSFLTSNFLLSDVIETAYESSLTQYSEQTKAGNLPYWYLTDRQTRE